jgi:Protein of unknown function (DUF4089)
MADAPMLPEDWRRYLEATAAAHGLVIPPEDLPVLIAIFANLARVAEPLMAFPLPDDTDQAPVFIPGSLSS